MRSSSLLHLVVSAETFLKSNKAPRSILAYVERPLELGQKIKGIFQNADSVRSTCALSLPGRCAPFSPPSPTGLGSAITAEVAEAPACDVRSGLRTEPGTDQAGRRGRCARWWVSRRPRQGAPHSDNNSQRWGGDKHDLWGLTDPIHTKLEVNHASL